MRDLWEAQVTHTLNAIAPNGTFDLTRYAGISEPVPDEAAWSLHIRGHLIECLFVHPDRSLLANVALHRMVSRTISEAKLYLDSPQALANLVNGTGPFTYASACHLAHGLMLYRKACAAPVRKARPATAKP